MGIAQKGNNGKADSLAIDLEEFRCSRVGRPYGSNHMINWEAIRLCECVGTTEKYLCIDFCLV
jgi:hypothetical protein